MTRETWNSKLSFSVPRQISPSGLRLLQHWQGYFRSQGADFMLVPPVMLEGNNSNLSSPGLWNRIEHARQQMADAGVPLNCDLVGSVFSSLYRLDTVYHLNAEGAHLRSEQLAKCLIKHISGEDTETGRISAPAAAKAASDQIATQEQNFGYGDMPFQRNLRALTMEKASIVAYHHVHGVYPMSKPEKQPLEYWSDGESFRLLAKSDGSDCTVIAANWPELIYPPETKDGDITVCGSYGYWSTKQPKSH